MSKSDPKWHPKVTPKSFKWTKANPSKHIVFIVWATQWPPWGGFGNHTFLWLLRGAVFFDTFGQTLTIWVPKRSPKRTPLSWRSASRNQQNATKGQDYANGGSQWCCQPPRCMEMTPKSEEKSNQISTPELPHRLCFDCVVRRLFRTRFEPQIKSLDYQAVSK